MAGGRAARGAAAEGRSTAASKQTRMACRRTAADSHAEKSGRGAGGAGAAGSRVVTGTAAEGRLRPCAAPLGAGQQTCVMWSEQLGRIALGSDCAEGANRAQRA